VLAVQRRSGFLIALAVALVGGLSLLATPAIAAPNPAGNNGTIKIDRVPFDDLSDNEPHVGCTFQVDFYGFDEGDLNATVTFAAQPPTPPGGSPGAFEVLPTEPTTVFIGEDDNSGGGSEAGLDASQTYTLDLTGITPHPEQGVHVKLTIHAPDNDSQGADTKFKVFWVTGCGGEESSTTSSSTTTSTTMKGGSTTTSGSTTTTLPGGSTTTSTTMASGSSELGTGSSGGGSGSSGGAGASAAARSGLPLTGSESVPLVLAGLALLGLGVAMIGRSRQRRRT
jgi:LPXTG-motif cell wall-anchored protein